MRRYSVLTILRSAHRLEAIVRVKKFPELILGVSLITPLFVNPVNHFTLIVSTSVHFLTTVTKN